MAGISGCVDPNASECSFEVVCEQLAYFWWVGCLDVIECKFVGVCVSLPFSLCELPEDFDVF